MNRSGLIRILRQNSLILFTLLCVGIGFGIGILLRNYNLSENAITWIEIPGELFFRCLNMLVLPLILPSIFVAISSMNPKDSTKTIGIVLSYGIFINIIMNSIALGFFYLIKPGSGKSLLSPSDASKISGTSLTPSDLLADFFRNLIPNNLVEAFFSSTLTVYTNTSTNEVKKDLVVTPGSNIIGLVVVTIFFGLIANTMKDQVIIILEFMTAIQKIVADLFKKLFIFMPIGIMSIIIGVIIKTSDINAVFYSLGYFSLTVSLTLMVQLFIFIPLTILLVTRRNPIYLMGRVVTGLLVSISTASSLSGVAKLSESLSNEFDCDSNQAGSAVALSVPICASGSTAYITCALMFCTAIQNTPLSPNQIVIAIFLNSLAVIALPTIPNASIVLVIILLKSFGLASDFAALLFTIDWLLDRLRTGVNYYNMAVCSMIACKSSKFTKESKIVL